MNFFFFLQGKRVKDLSCGNSDLFFLVYTVYGCCESILGSNLSWIITKSHGQEIQCSIFLHVLSFLQSLANYSISIQWNGKSFTLSVLRAVPIMTLSPNRQILYVCKAALLFCTESIIEIDISLLADHYFKYSFSASLWLLCYH